jgi:HD superfamily phosphodiesterase
MFDQRPGCQLEAVLFHDADTLDFMGTIGITRMISIVGLDDWTPTLPKAIDLIERFSLELPDRLITSEAREVGRVRRAEMESFLAALRQQTSGLANL